MSIAARVLERVLTPSRVLERVRTAGFVPDKFWTSKKAELRKILDEPLKRSGGDHIRWKIYEQLEPFFKKFMEDLKGFGVHQFAEQSIDMRVEDIIMKLGKVGLAYDDFHSACNAVAYPPQGALDETVWSLQIQVEGLLQDKVKTLKDALKASWKTDPHLIRGLAERLLKKATPEERKAIEQASKEDYGPSSTMKWEFFRRMNVDSAIKRVVTVSKKEWKVDPINWIDFLKTVLESVHSEGKLEAFSEFDLHGVKVVVNDMSLGTMDVNAYVKYMEKAYALLKSKHLEKVWYGTFFVSCQSCGGYNQNTSKWNDVGGNYPIGPDVVNIFSRPSSFIVELLAHELGHRYWFKFMTQAQRGKFESLVKAHKSHRPIEQKPNTIPQDKVKEAKEKVDLAAKAMRSWLIPLKSSRKKWFRDILKENVETIGRAGWTFSNDLLDAVHAAGAEVNITPEVRKLFDEQLAAGSAVQKYTWGIDQDISDKMHAEPEPAEAPESRDVYWMSIYRKARDAWLEGLEQKIEEAVTNAYIFIDAAVQEYNKREESRSSDAWKKFNEEYDTDERPVTPVSDYGKSNIDEAFAEVFAHYVLEFDMNRDQLDSFKSVLSSRATPKQLFDAFLALL